MPHGSPDWGAGAPKSTVYALNDLGELAVRLGSIVMYDRRGDVVAIEDFENGMNRWSWGADGTNPAVTLVCFPSQHGSLAVKITSPDQDEKSTFIRRRVFKPVLSKYGLEISFKCVAQLYKMRLQIAYFTGSVYYAYFLVYDHNAGTVAIIDENGVEQTIGTCGTQSTSEEAFTNFKLVVDLVNQMYVRGIVNGVSYDASTYEPTVAASGTAKSVTLGVWVTSTGTTQSSPVVDSIIVTQNEPD